MSPTLASILSAVTIIAPILFTFLAVFFITRFSRLAGIVLCSLVMIAGTARQGFAFLGLLLFGVYALSNDVSKRKDAEINKMKAQDLD